MRPKSDTRDQPDGYKASNDPTNLQRQAKEWYQLVVSRLHTDHQVNNLDEKEVICDYEEICSYLLSLQPAFFIVSIPVIFLRFLA